ncbi:10434_t:CDS:2, partial [Racocetra persica]
MFKKNQFWESVTNRLNNCFNSSYTNKQYKDKFAQLVKEYNVFIEAKVFYLGNYSIKTSKLDSGLGQ